MSTSVFRTDLLICLGNGAFVVGGAVRDRLLGRKTPDLDVVVPANAGKAAVRLADRLAGTAFPLHAELDIHRVVAGPIHIDVARMQGASIEEDLDRRDLTVNAMAVRLNDWFGPSWRRRIIDRHGGVDDVRRRRLAPVSAAAFREDPLRILRTFRIAAELGFTIAPEALRRIRADRRLAARPAPERQRDEFLKMFATDGSHAALVAMDRGGVLDVVFPPAAPLRRTAPGYYGPGGVLKHTLDSVKFFEEILDGLKSWFPSFHGKIRAYLDEPIGGHPRRAHCKWALLLHDIGKPKTAKVRGGRLRFFEHEHVGADMVSALSPRYRWSSDETTRYARLVRNHMRPGNLATHDEITDKAVHRFFRDLDDDGIAMLLVSLADHLTYLSAAQRRRRNSPHEKTTLMMVSRFYRNPKKVMPARLLTGHDVMKAFGLPPSPLIGRLLAEAHDANVDGKVKNAKEALAFLKPIVAALSDAERGAA